MRRVRTCIRIPAHGFNHEFVYFTHGHLDDWPPVRLAIHFEGLSGDRNARAREIIREVVWGVWKFYRPEKV
jgi:hypothetical protein